jgi:hypothetical protein
MEIVSAQVTRKNSFISFIQQAYFVRFCGVYATLFCAMEDTVVPKILLSLFLTTEVRFSITFCVQCLSIFAVTLISVVNLTLL